MNATAVVDLSSLQSIANSDRNAFLDTGVMVIENAIDDVLIRRLSENLVTCDLSPEESDIFRSRTLDGSLRATFATAARDEFVQCDETVRELVRTYKERTRDIGLHVAEFLDSLTPHGVRSIKDLISDEDATSLDHFHVYRAEGSSNSPDTAVVSKDHSIPFHVDMGLFLILTPATWVGGRSEIPDYDSDLIIKRKDGSTFPLAPRNPGSVILLVGAGLSNWMSGGSSGLRAAVHAVNPISSVLGGNRVVLGRMFLPPMDAIAGNGVQFEDFFMSSLRLSPRDTIDSSSREWRRLMEARCEAGTKYCWMDCMPDVDCGADLESVCMNPLTQKVCFETDCDTDCTVMCPPRPSTLAPTTTRSNNSGSDNTSGSSVQVVMPRQASSDPVQTIVTLTNEPPETPFCRGGTSMVMSGFESVGSANANCIILFFRPWLLNTPLKFGIGCLGVFLLGAVVEATIKLRRYATNKMKSRGRFWREFVVISLFAVNVALGYLCMLAAMTFNVEIFISTVMGLAIGHLVLGNSAEPVRETADPCCVTSEAVGPDRPTTSLVNSTGACCCDTRPRM